MNIGWMIKLSHIYLEENSCTNALANLAPDLKSPRVLFEQPPKAIRESLTAYCMGMSTLLLISQ